MIAKIMIKVPTGCSANRTLEKSKISARGELCHFVSPDEILFRAEGQHQEKDGNDTGGKQFDKTMSSPAFLS